MCYNEGVRCIHTPQAFLVYQKRDVVSDTPLEQIFSIFEEGKTMRKTLGKISRYGIYLTAIRSRFWVAVFGICSASLGWTLGAGISIGVLVLIVLIFVLHDDGLPEPLDEPIEADHGDNLETVMEALRDESLEYGVVFMPDGNKLGEWTLLSPTEVGMPVEWSARLHYGFVGMTDLHCHPGIDENSFSPEDFGVSIMYHFRRSIVVTRHYNYILENPNYRESAIDANEIEAYADILWGYKCAIIADCLGMARWWSIYISYRTAKEFGLKFSVQNIRIEKIKRLVRKLGEVVSIHLYTQRRSNV